ncbi:probable cytochrome P450 301a1, mitochondrial [Schistocerca nitens]|uniref:probable cytochrome P450 301a1, mitochondrial n=1 Tax=Schistocerca nitens TaxID=7011 RepID=UPI002117A044|nr:probable cytochrome P450 301a1, mitochondrial [Schistocerca nitens]XP_049812227.1 probable cytochrome P450 301a1, mitochondrial [Schistocerca nitens]XP_049812228.1 probable cytochrome P450 301a1, mitochondrial [Schistocerca nitens]
MLSASPQRVRQLAAVLSRGRATVAAAATTGAPHGATEEWLRARPFEEIPGPKALPIIGNAWRFLLPTGDFKGMDMMDLVYHIREKYGDIAKLDGMPGRPPLVFLYNANDIEKVYRNEGPRPVRDSIKSLQFYREVTRKDLFGDIQGVAFTQGEQWYEFRRRVNQPMMQPRSSKLYVPSIDKVAQDFTDRMLAIRDENMKMPSDFLNELNKWALESISLVALDTRLGCLEGNLPPDSEPQRMIEAAHTVFDCMLKLDLQPSPWRYISTPNWRRMVKAQDYFYQVALRRINEAMDRMKKRGPADVSAGELSVLERLLISNDDPRVAIVMALDMMFAGIDTTANSAATALYFLSKNQRVQEKLYQELRAQLPDSASQPLTADKMEACKYLKACVKESMRLRPVALGGSRQVVADNLVLSNYRVPKGVDLSMANVVLANSEEHFSRPSDFLPERWLKGGESSQTAHPFAFMPFGFGPRTCIGRRFAETEIYTLLARVVRRFRLEFDGEMRWRTTVLHGPVAPLTLKVTEREREV